MKQITPQPGSISCDQILSRQAAGQRLDPPISERQVRRYLEVLMLFSDRFKEFEHPETGGLNKDTKLTNWHLPELQMVRSMAQRISLKKIRTFLYSQQEQAQ
jgi:hypothetical protein